MDRACAIVLHPDGDPLRLLVFDHPNGDTQLVLSDINADEAPERAAAQGLFEKSGLETQSALQLGQSTITPDARWKFVLCRAKPPVRLEWQHFSKDGVCRFHWIALEEPPALKSPFDQAFSFVQTVLSGG